MSLILSTPYFIDASNSLALRSPLDHIHVNIFGVRKNEMSAQRTK